MTGTNVIWLSLRPETPCRGFWDNEIIERLLDGTWWHPPGSHGFTHHEIAPAIDGHIPEPPTGDGAIVVLSARHHDRIADRVNTFLLRLPWVLLILAGDEEGSFPAEWLAHPRMLLWVMTPRHDRHTYPAGTRWLPNGSTPHAHELLAGMTEQIMTKPRDWSFAGQITHRDRHACAAALHLVGPDERNPLLETHQFASGLSRHDFVRLLAESKIAPCPGGPQTPDTFRTWEALEAGAIPIVDGPDYWESLDLGQPPFPVLTDWSQLPDILPGLLSDWEHTAARAAAWLINVRRTLVNQLHDDLARLTGRHPEPRDINDEITVLVPTSPIPTHPDPAILETTLDSIRARLPGAQIVLMCDGIRGEQEHRRAAYGTYLRHVTARAVLGDWGGNVRPVVFTEHLHQAEMTRRVLDDVDTEHVLFVEHDTPLVGDIPFAELAGATRSGAGVIRLHHEPRIHPEHEYLTLGPPTDIAGVPLRPTRQWSQRPHLARTDLYRRLLRAFFSPRDRTMIEDVLHGRIQDLAAAGRWKDIGLHIYHPDGDIRRSGNSDGRGDDPKYDMTTTVVDNAVRAWTGTT